MDTISRTDGARVLGYARVSTAEQATNGHGLEVQTDAIRAYCTEHGLTLTRIATDEGESGSNGLDSRAGLAQAIAELEAGRASALVVYRLDRLARDLGLQETIITQLKRRGASIISLAEDVDSMTDDPTRVLVRQVMGTFAEYERALIRGRMAAGLNVKRRNGGYTGGRAPLGKQVVDHELVVDPAEAATVARILELRADGCSYRQICTALTAEGRSTRRGGPWLPASVRKVWERVAGG